MKKSMKTKSAIIALMLVACLAVAGVSAYFTDAAAATNTFTIGEVSLELTEPDWVEPEIPVVPNQTVEKDPTIKNDGKNSEYVFLTVAVPYANVVVADADGTKKDAADTELFSYTVNSGWEEIGTAVKANGVVTHTYAYGSETELTALAVNGTTPALFDSVTFANVIEGQNLESTTQKIEIKAYGIQSENIGDSKVPSAVWTIICNQRDDV